MVEEESPKCPTQRTVPTSANDDRRILDQLLLLPARKKPAIDAHLTLNPYNIDDSLGFSFPPLETETQLIEKMRHQGYQVELNTGKSLRRSLFVRRQEWLKVTSRLNIQLPQEENSLEIPIMPRMSPFTSRRSIPQVVPLIYPRPKQILAKMESTMWFDVENLLSNCKSHRKMDGRDIEVEFFGKHKPFGVPLTFMLDQDGRHRDKFKHIPEEEREFVASINGIILPRRKIMVKATLPNFKAIDAENLPVLKKQNLLQRQFEADISLLTDRKVSSPSLTIDPFDMLVKKGMAMVEIIGSCDLEKPIFSKRTSLVIEHTIPEIPKSAPFLSMEDGMEEVGHLRLFRRHEQTWWCKGPQEIMARGGHLKQLQFLRDEKDEILPREIEMGEIDCDADLYHQFRIDLEEREVKDIETIGGTIEDYLVDKESEDGEGEEEGTALSTRQLISLGFKYYPPKVVETDPIRGFKDDVLAETHVLIRIQEEDDGDEDMVDVEAFENLF